MDIEHLIIDGYNLLHLDDALKGHRTDFQTARQRLVRRIEGVALEMAPRMTVVFDGREMGCDASLSTGHVDVIFSPSNRTADAVIERMVSEAKCPERILVVTSDRVEEQIVSAAGAFVLSCAEFLRRCDAQEPVVSHASKSVAATLGDFFPKSTE